MFDQVKIILINTTHPGNIGAVARAMKNMGFKHLCLVSPKYFPSDEANARASGALELLENASVVETLDEALRDCHWVLGLSARSRKLAIPTLTAREGAINIASRLLGSPDLKVGLLFGQEQSGLSNEALAKCHFQINIPANPEYVSLNIAQAAQILTYELRMAILSIKASIVSNNDDILQENKNLELAKMGEVESFYEHLEKTLIDIQFLVPESPGYLMRHLRRLFAKSHLTKTELNILHGILTNIEKGV